MTRSSDLAERIARLERLLDAIEQARRSDSPASAAAGSGAPADRLRDLTAIVQQRISVPEPDEGDAVALRALIDQFRLTVSELRVHAADLNARLEAIDAAATRAGESLGALEDIS